jgi:hypothetical protein
MSVHGAPPVWWTILFPLSFAPVVPFLNDADGDGIPNSQERVVTVDTDGDGRPTSTTRIPWR